MSAQIEMFPINTWDSTYSYEYNIYKATPPYTTDQFPLQKDNLANKTLIAIKCIGHMKIKQRQNVMT